MEARLGNRKEDDYVADTLAVVLLLALAPRCRTAELGLLPERTLGVVLVVVIALMLLGQLRLRRSRNPLWNEPSIGEHMNWDQIEGK